MYWFGKRTISVTEYTSASARAHRRQLQSVATSHGALSFTKIRLAVALAKTIMTRDPLDMELFLETVSALFRLQVCISGTSPELRVCENFRLKYRDFSKNGRIGELAQSISFIFAQDSLRYPIVMDYFGFLDSNGITLPNIRDSRPDFVLLLREPPGSFALLESKGICQSRKALVKSDLKKSLLQCDQGVRTITAARPALAHRNSYAVAVELPERTDAWEPSLSYTDPENEQTQSEFDLSSSLRHYYAAWFSLAGRFDIAYQIMDQRFDPSKESFDEVKIGTHKYLFLRDYNESFIHVLSRSFPYIGGYPYARFGIDLELIWSLAKNDIANLVKILSASGLEQEMMLGRVELYRDGTALLI